MPPKLEPGDWLDIHGFPARVVEVTDGRLIVDVYRTEGVERRTYTAPFDGPFPELPSDRIPTVKE